MSDIASRVRKIISGQLGVDEPAILPESRLIEDLNADSLDIVEMVMKAEDEFDVSIPDEAGNGIRTFGDLVAYLESQKKEGDPPAATVRDGVNARDHLQEAR
jgi:acyl carrier protein